MAVSTYTTNLTDLFAGAGSTTNWSALGGGQAALAAETDYFIQGTGCLSKGAFTSARKGMMFDCVTDRASLVGTDGAFLLWTTQTSPNSLDTIANGGITMLVGSSDTDYSHWYIGGSDTIPFLGWILGAVNPSETTDEADAGTPGAVEDHVGVLFDLPSGGPTKGNPNAIDAIRVGRCDLIYELGTSTDPDASFDLAVTSTGDETNRLGLIQERAGVFYLSGLHQLGDNASDVVNFTDSNKSLFWNDHPAVTAPFNTLEIQNASSTVDMTNIAWKALGSKSPGTWLTTQDATVNITGCTFTDWGEFEFDSNTTCRSTTWVGCGRILLEESDLASCSILESGVAANEGSVYDNRSSAAQLSGDWFEGCTFSKGANAHHAVRQGVSAGRGLTFTDVEFTGFNGTDDQNDSTIKLDNTTGNYSITLVNCTVDGGAPTQSNFGVHQTGGGTYSLVIDGKTTQITVSDVDGNAIQNARVFLETADGDNSGSLPFEEAITSITQSSGTATVTTTAPHGLDGSTDQVVIRNATPEEYNKTTDVTITGASTFTYTVDSGLSTPAGGTPIYSYTPIHGLTNASGVIFSKIAWPASQSLVGWARKSTTAPFYRQVSISVPDASVDVDVAATLISDE